MSTLLSRPLLIDQDDHKLRIPDGRLENITDTEVPHPLSSVALQASLGLHVFHLFQNLSTDHSVQLVLEIGTALDKWLATFPAALRDHRPDTRWDEKYPNVPFMRCQINVIAYSYLLAPLKPYLLGKADPEVMRSPIGTEFRAKGVDTCLDLMRSSERFYDLAFPQNVKYFFIIFFLFDAATVMCSAIVHDTHHTLPKRCQCIRALRTAQELMDGVAHLSEAARISAQLLRKLAVTLPLTEAEKDVLMPSRPSSTYASSSSSKKVKSSPSPHIFASAGLTSGLATGEEFDPTYNISNGQRASTSSVQTDSFASTIASPSYSGPPHQQQQQQQQQYHHQHQHAQPEHRTEYQPGYIPLPPVHSADWGFVDYNATGLPVTTGPSEGATYGSMEPLSGAPSQQMMVRGAGQPGGPLTGTYLEPLWDWERLNMDLSQGHHYGSR